MQGECFPAELLPGTPELADDHQLPLTWIPLVTTKTEDYGGQGVSREPAGALADPG